MNTSPATVAHSLYSLYENLPEDVQKTFLQELVQKKSGDIAALALVPSVNAGPHNKVILGLMEGAFSVPDNFDEPLSDVLLNDFYSQNL